MTTAYHRPAPSHVTRARALDAVCQSLLAITREARDADSEVNALVRDAIASIQRAALRAGWIE